MGAIDCAMNIQAVAVEKAARSPMMSGFHGLYSLGSLVGALAAGGILAAGFGAAGTTVAAVATIVLLIALAWPGILPRGRRRAGRPSRFPAASCW